MRIGWHRGSFVVVWYEDGRRQRRSLGTDQRDVAETRFAAFRAELQRTAPRSVGAIFERYDDGETGGGRARYAWKRLAPVYGNLRPEDVSETVTQDYIADRQLDGARPDTIHTELTYLRASLQFAHRKGWIESVPYIPMPRRSPPRTTTSPRRRIGATSAWTKPGVRAASTSGSACSTSTMESGSCLRDGRASRRSCRSPTFPECPSTFIDAFRRHPGQENGLKLEDDTSG